MNTRKILLTAVLCVASLAASAQNPIIRGQFSADPTARVFNDRVYLFPSHDIPAPDDYPRKDWFCMADYHVFSSDNLTDWVDHGVIISQEDVEWGNPKGYAMWAPDCVEKDGKYYFYFPDGLKTNRGFGIGVAVADLPDGKYTLQSEPIKGIWGIDPCVMQCSNGDAYIFFGGGFISVAKLSPDMLSIEGEPQRISTLPQGFVEGPFAFEYEGHYYLTFPWVEKNTETLAYAMSDSPMGPYEFKGKIMEESPTGCWTNHHSIVNFKHQWYLFYHHNDYSPHFDKLRSVRCDSLFFNSDGTIRPVKPTLRGVGVNDARSRIQVDRYSTISPEGVAVDFASPDSVDRFQGWVITYKGKEAYSTYAKVDFASSVSTVTVRAKAPEGAVLTLTNLTTSDARHSARNKKRSTVTRVAVPANHDYQVITLPVRRSPQGIADLRLQSKDGRELTLDWIGFDLQQ